MFISPMLLEKSESAFSDPNYIFEPKFDGHRAILSCVDGCTRIYTRHTNECTHQYPELLTVPFTDNIVLDGEIVCIEPNGTVDFESVMTRFQARRSDSIRRLSDQLPVTFVVFDILRYRGKDLRGLSLMQRKQILSNVNLPNNPRINVVPFIETAGEALFSDICARKMEGIVCKRKDSTYVSRRSSDWLKVINWTYTDVWITGYRKEEFGWLAAVDSGNGKLRPAGIIELGVKPFHKKAFYGVRDSIITCEDKNNVYLQPALRAKVKTRNWTKAGLLRSPVFVDFAV
ncbi:ATP-dependent DNA ligase [Paenibacillus alvei]|uniref:ATP-dependent DNA ligase n=1 Tax=Paenibacillus alvei TaxID=44250 RepID=A0ABT4H1P1_PAEAL|nr:RNA ligase family protein [Paenibacillus alvei]EJW15624.1 phage DNA ligase-like protein LigB [Paenibacillus alvei DSM 29]MCY9542613.1 ATP-dependent DNA ligase [Paenibacillus alvei]MCY9706495.1 ATP-dependent DNA ligase [Paenibacillus alvei]MCY9736467.1 ATP-dependent DNA ligase [Paenibacillus alvei]MCY9758099.1 ATP-dependent DNA ligase [Paenibacillus alvei]